MITLKQLYRYLTVDPEADVLSYNTDFSLHDDSIIGVVTDNDGIEFMQFVISQGKDTFDVCASPMGADLPNSIFVTMCTRIMQWAFTCRLNKFLKSICSVEF
jgi:hypothetical protein